MQFDKKNSLNIALSSAKKLRAMPAADKKYLHNIVCIFILTQF